MKKTILYSMFFGLLIINVNAQTSEKDNAMIDSFIKTKITIEKEKIESDTLARVFNGVFYRIGAGYAFSENNGGTCSNDIFVLDKGVLRVLENSMDSIKTLVSLVREGFYLKSPTDAKIFEVALGKIYPEEKSKQEYKENLKVNNKWYFLRDKFFDSKSGYIVSLDKNSKIINISYSLEAIQK
jgi:hypothetical protein